MLLALFCKEYAPITIMTEIRIFNSHGILGSNQDAKPNKIPIYSRCDDLSFMIFQFESLLCKKATWRFALVACGRALTQLDGRNNSKPQNPHQPLRHDPGALLGRNIGWLLYRTRYSRAWIPCFVACLIAPLIRWLMGKIYPVRSRCY